MLACAAGPAQQILRPAELEEEQLEDDLKREALFGTERMFEPSQGTTAELRGNALHLVQDDRALKLDEQGSVLLVGPALRRRGRGFDPRDAGIFMALIEEDVQGWIERGLRFADRILDRIDGTHRLTHMAPAVAIYGSAYLGWQTQDEHERNPNVVTAPFGAASDQAAHLVPPHLPRAALRLESRRVADDLVVLLRRARQGRMRAT